MKIFYEYTVRNEINVPEQWTDEEVYDYLRENVDAFGDITWWKEHDYGD